MADHNFLAKCNPHLRKQVLEHADKKLILVLHECMLNFLRGNINLDEKRIAKYLSSLIVKTA
jgi:hypothetical protein